ncbi:MAG: tetratricopeptide repeat protein [Candidatus Marinimicrobia bacterium]|jgi:tetratricopeptide (TPR) repeat protein|nr:tetratricopeptide repeat protein [Candidatus Neomarinimicrobiota bacterium]MDP6788953.1 tetratricopeptide repeat protein [Candidatus Neomarinimicrobiota bacterium]MDP7072271.1 tetratricopeptide repeat protein [Candidatus Neomarinimicrobiota bacterium]
MLKPKKKMYQKELKRDPLLEGVSSIQQNIETHSTLYRNGLIGIVAIALIGTMITRNMKAKAEEAHSILNRAMVLFEQGDVDNALLEFEAIRDDYGRTPSGKISAFYLGRLYFDRGEYDLAETYMTAYVKNPEIAMLASSAYATIGKLAEIDEDYRTAIKNYSNAVQSCVIKTDLHKYNLELASMYILDESESDAHKILDEIINDTNPSNPFREKAERLKGQL